MRVRFLEAPGSPSIVGTEDMAFATDVVGILETPGITPAARAESAATAASNLAQPVTITTPEQTLERLLFEREIDASSTAKPNSSTTARFNDWIELVADDIHYHMPVRRNVKFGEQARENSSSDSEISWFDEGKRTLAGRVRQINTGLHWAEEPPLASGTSSAISR